jgi:hypothetical protein
MTALARRLRRSGTQLLRNALARYVDDAADLFWNIGNRLHKDPSHLGARAYHLEYSDLTKLVVTPFRRR